MHVGVAGREHLERHRECDAGGSWILGNVRLCLGSILLHGQESDGGHRFQYKYLLDSGMRGTEWGGGGFFASLRPCYK